MDDITRYSVFWNAIRSIDAFDASFPDNQWLEGVGGGGHWFMVQKRVHAFFPISLPGS